MAGKEFNLLFVYGTLKRGESNHNFFLRDINSREHAEFICECKLKERYPLVVSGYPSLLNRPGMGKVVCMSQERIQDWARGGHINGEHNFAHFQGEAHGHAPPPTKSATVS